MKLPFFKKDSENEPLRAYLQSILRNAIELKRPKSQKRTPAEPPLGTSKIGGKPHLPADFAWPYYEGESYEGGWADRPLSFIAQIDLAAIAACDKEGLLPTSGYLYFFYEVMSQKWGFDPADEGCARVYYYDVPADALCVTDLPADLAAEARVPLIPLKFGTMDELPGYEEFLDLTDKNRFGEHLDWDLYDETVAEMIEIPDSDEIEICKLLGYANLIQGSMLSECARVTAGLSCGSSEDYRKTTEEQKAAICADAPNWILLAQFDSLSDEILFGDCGCIYFYIRREDLAARRFDRVWLCLQCG